MIRPTTHAIFAAVLFVLVFAGCQTHQRCSNCHRGYAPTFQESATTPADDAAPPIPEGVPKIPGVGLGARLPRITLPRFRSDSQGPSLLQRVKFGLSRLNPLKRFRPQPSYPPLDDPNSRLQPIPESSLPHSETPTPVPPPSGPEFGDPQALWNRLTPKVDLPRQPSTRTTAEAGRIEDWPHATLPGRLRGGQAPANIQPDVANDNQPAVRFRPARFSRLVPYIPPQSPASQPPAAQPQRLRTPAAGPIVRRPNAYRSYREAGPISHSAEIPVRNFQ